MSCDNGWNDYMCSVTMGGVRDGSCDDGWSDYMCSVTMGGVTGTLEILLKTGIQWGRGKHILYV